MINSKKGSGRRQHHRYNNRKTRRAYNSGGSKDTDTSTSPKKSRSLSLPLSLSSPPTDYDDEELIREDGSAGILSARPRKQPALNFTPAQIRQFNMIRANILKRETGPFTSSRKRLLSRGLAQHVLRNLTNSESPYFKKLIHSTGHAQRKLLANMVQTNYMPVINLFDAPRDIAVDRVGNLVIADSAHRRVCAINPFTGAILRTIPFAHPYSISFVFDKDGITDELIVADYEGVFLVNYATGDRIRSIYTYGRMDDYRATSVLYDGAIQLRFTHKMFYYTLGGKKDPDNTVDIDGSGPMAYNTKNRFKYNESIIVADSVKGTLYETKSGEVFPVLENSIGSGPGQFKGIAGIAVDCVGNVIVSDKGNHRIQIFNPDFTEVRIIGNRGDAYGEFKNPTGLAVDCNGNIFVCDTGNNRIQVIRYRL